MTDRAVIMRGSAHIAGSYEHPDRRVPDKSVPQVHAEVALGAVRNADLDRLGVGMPVDVVFHGTAAGAALPRSRPASGGTPA